MANPAAMEACRAYLGDVTALAVSNNRKFLVSGGEQGEVRVWEIRTQAMIRHLKQHTFAVTSLAILQDDGEVCWAPPMPSLAPRPAPESSGRLLRSKTAGRG